MKELLIGCGKNRDKKMHVHGEIKEWQNLTTLDIDPSSGCDVVWDLNKFPYPFEDGEFDEVHAYEVLEHTGTQGDWKFFFTQFAELHRILKPDGLLFASVPIWNSPWAWGDPGHTRIISRASVTFLAQSEYEKQIGKTSMTDYRDVWTKDFPAQFIDEGKDSMAFVLKAVK